MSEKAEKKEDQPTGKPVSPPAAEKTESKTSEGVEKTKQAARDYLAKHKIIPLFEKLCVDLVYNKPENPREFLIKQLEALHKLEETKRNDIKLFTDDDLDTLFNMFNPVGTSQLPAAQAQNALRMLGISEAFVTSQIDKNEKYTKQDFKRIARAGLSDV